MAARCSTNWATGARLHVCLLHCTPWMATFSQRKKFLFWARWALELVFVIQAKINVTWILGKDIDNCINRANTSTLGVKTLVGGVLMETIGYSLSFWLKCWAKTKEASWDTYTVCKQESFKNIKTNCKWYINSKWMGTSQFTFIS